WAGAVTTSWPNWCRAAARACTALARASSSWRILDDAAGVLGDRGALAGEDFAGGGLGVDRVVLAAPVSGVCVWPVDLHHCHAGGVQMPGQPGAVGARGLHSDLADRSVSAHPGQ